MIGRFQAFFYQSWCCSAAVPAGSGNCGSADLALKLLIRAERERDRKAAWRPITAPLSSWLLHFRFPEFLVFQKWFVFSTRPEMFFVSLKFPVNLAVEAIVSVPLCSARLCVSQGGSSPVRDFLADIRRPSGNSVGLKVWWWQSTRLWGTQTLRGLCLCLAENDTDVLCPVNFLPFRFG